MAETTGQMPAKRGVSEFPLKLAAIVGMTLDHAAYIFSDCLPYPVTCAFFFGGGLTFLTMAFMLTEGYRHTRSVKKYAVRLFVFALVSQVPFWLFLGHSLNVMFTLLLSLGVIYADEHMENRAEFAGVFLLALVLSMFCDWAVIGPVAVYLFHRCRGTKSEAVLAPAVTALVTAASAASMAADGDALALPTLLYAVGNLCTAPLIALYNGSRGRSMKYFFYAYYPAHILVLGMAHYLAFGYIAPVVA